MFLKGQCVCKCRCTCGSQKPEEICKCLKKAPVAFIQLPSRLRFVEWTKLRKYSPLSKIKRNLTKERKGGKKAHGQNDFTPKKPRVNSSEQSTNTNQHPNKNDQLE